MRSSSSAELEISGSRDVRNGYCIRVCIYIYICKKRERDTNSWMLISTEASILRNQRFSIIINPRVRAVVRRKKIKEGEKKERNNKKKKKKKENEKSNRKM